MFKIIATSIFTVLILAGKAQNQNELSATLPDGNYTVYKCEGGGMLMKTTKPWGVTFKRNGSQTSEVVVNRMNILEENFRPDFASYPAYFHYEGSRIMVMDGNILYYKTESGSIKLLFVLCPPGKEAQGDGAPIQDKILKQQSASVKNQTEGRAEVVRQKQHVEEKNKAEASLKGKNLKSLMVKVLDGDKKNGPGSQIHYGIEAELTDGKILKTSNLGGYLPWEDLDIQVTGARFGEEAVVVKEDVSQIPGDEVIISVRSRHHSLKANANISLLYNTPVELNYNGKSSIHAIQGEHGQSGKSLTVKIKKAASAKGAPLLKIEVSDKSGQVIQRLKMSPESVLTINATGDDGTSHSDFYKNAGNGGNGGDILIVRDNGTENFVIKITNRGGLGARNKENSKRDGQNGRDGIITDQSGPVNLNW